VMLDPRLDAVKRNARSSACFAFGENGRRPFVGF